jgi:nucleoid DNA-binding protein
MGRSQTVLADTVSKDLELPLRVGREFVDRFLALVTDDIVFTGEVRLDSLGTFSVTTRPPAQVTHPGTGTPVSVPSKKILKLRTAPSLKKRLNS